MISATTTQARIKLKIVFIDFILIVSNVPVTLSRGDATDVTSNTQLSISKVVHVVPYVKLRENLKFNFIQIEVSWILNVIE